MITAAIPALRPVVSDDYYPDESSDDEKLALVLEHQYRGSENCVEPVSCPPAEIPLHLDPAAQLPPWMPSTDAPRVAANDEEDEEDEEHKVPFWHTVLGAMAMSASMDHTVPSVQVPSLGAPWGLAPTGNMRGSIGMPIPGYPGYDYPFTMRSGGAKRD